MKQRNGIIKNYFWCIVLLLTIMSFTFLLMPIANYMQNGWKQRLVLVIVGILFWISFISGYTLLIITNKKFRKLFVQGNPEVESKLPNCFEFFSNTYAAVADAILIAVIVVLIVITILGRMTGVFPYIVLAILVFSINIHCLFNGNIYKTIRTNDTRERKRCKGMKDVN